MKEIFAMMCVLSVAASCTRSGVFVEIRNRSERTIDSIRVYTSNGSAEIVFERLRGFETRSQFLPLAKEQPPDARIIVTYKTGSSTFNEPVHYFASEEPLGEKLRVVVAPNAVSRDD